jgi:hypothetical protein
VKNVFIYSRFTIHGFYLFNDPQEVRDGGDEAAHRGRVGTLDDLIELRQTQALDNLFLSLWERDGAAVVLNANRRAAVTTLLFFILVSHFDTS